MIQAKPHYQKGKGLGASKVADFDSVALSNVKPKAKRQAPKRTVLNTLTSPFAPMKVQHIQAEDEERKKGKFYAK